MKKIYTCFLLTALLCVFAGFGPAAAEDSRIKVEKDILYYGAAKYEDPLQMLDVYHVEGKTNLPVMVFIHGGGWQKGSKEAVANVARALAEKNIVTVVINYRLSPSHDHPDQVMDAARAFAWTYNNIKDYGGDPGRIFVGGHSAGAHLAALLVLDPSYLKKFNVPDGTIYGSVLVSGVYWLAFGSRPWSVPRESPLMKMIEPTFGNTVESLVEASPMAFKRPDVSPMLIMVGGNEKGLLPVQAGEFYRAMLKEGAPVQYFTVPGRNHQTMVSGIGRKDDPCTKKIVEFILFRSYD